MIFQTICFQLCGNSPDNNSIHHLRDELEHRQPIRPHRHPCNQHIFEEKRRSFLFSENIFLKITKFGDAWFSQTLMPIIIIITSIIIGTLIYQTVEYCSELMKLLLLSVKFLVASVGSFLPPPSLVSSPSPPFVSYYSHDSTSGCSTL